MDKKLFEKNTITITKENKKEIEEKYSGHQKCTFICEDCGKESILGVRNIMFHSDLLCKRCRIKRTVQERYGVDCITQAKSFKDKCKETCLERYGVEYSFQAEKTKNSMKKTFLKKYGVENPLQSEVVKEKIRATNRERYGVDYGFSSDIVKQKIKDTCLEKYGVENPFQDKDIIEYIKKKAEKTMRERYGVKKPCQLREVRLRSQKKYTYHNIGFDSSWELAFYIYLKDSNIDFEFQPDNNIYYSVDGVSHKHFPDFLIDGKLFEIKGGQFIDENKNLVNPYSNSEKIKKELLAKQKCMRDNNVTVLTRDDVKKYLDYVKQKYGSKYLKSF